MRNIPPDVIHKLSTMQNQIWQTVSLTASEACNQAVSFCDALTVASPTADLYAEMSAPKLVIQFSFANMPENSQIILFPQDTFAELVQLMGNVDRNVDENLIADIRPWLESTVQGICLAVGNLRGDAVVASGLSIRFQIFSFPPNLQKCDEVVRVNVAIKAEEVNGNLMWLMDPETAHVITGIPMQTEEPHGAFGSSVDSRSGPSGSQFDESGLDILLDIPLEISVELGRVKMLVKDVVELGTGSIVEIDKAEGEPVDVLVNGRLVARGEVVVIDDNFGVRITEILTPQERLMKLNEVA